MFKPDTAQLVISLVLVLIAMIFVVVFTSRMPKSKKKFAILVGGIYALLLCAMVAVSGYAVAERHWDALAASVEGQQFRLVQISYPADEVEPQKTRSIHELFRDHAGKMPEGRLRKKKASSSGCEIVVVMENCPITKLSPMGFAFEDVYGCQTSVVGTIGPDGPPSLTAPI